MDQMKIKTVVFWILWVGNDLILQTIREQDPDPALPPPLPSHRDAKLDATQAFQSLGAEDRALK